MIDDDGGAIALLAQTQGASTPGARRISRIVVGIERPDAYKLASYRLGFLDGEGAFRELSINKLSPIGSSYNVWTIENIAAIPSTVRISKWGAPVLR